MRPFGPPPSGQMQIEGLGCEGEELMREARAWVSLHYPEWCWYKREASARSHRGEVSPKLMIELLRDEFRVELPNAIGPALARIAMEERPWDGRHGIRMRLARSKLDGFTTAAVRR